MRKSNEWKKVYLIEEIKLSSVDISVVNLIEIIFETENNLLTYVRSILINIAYAEF